MTTATDKVAAIQTALRGLGLPGTISEAIEGLVRFHTDPHGTTSEPSQGWEVVRLARHLHKQALRRTEAFGELLNNPAWNMLLDLAANDGFGVPVSSLCIASGGPATTALRHIGWLEAQGLVRREADPDDGRRSLIHLTDAARPKLHAAILALRVMPDTA